MDRGLHLVAVGSMMFHDFAVVKNNTTWTQRFTANCEYGFSADL